MAGERRLYLERNCRLPESPAHSRRRNREGPASSKGLNSQRGFGPAVEPRRKSRPRSTSLHGSSPCKCQRLSTLRWDRLPPSRPSTKSGARAGGRRLSDRRLHRWLAGTSASAPSSHGAADLLGLNRAHICVRNHKSQQPGLIARISVTGIDNPFHLVARERECRGLFDLGSFQSLGRIPADPLRIQTEIEKGPQPLQILAGVKRTVLPRLLKTPEGVDGELLELSAACRSGPRKEPPLKQILVFSNRLPGEIPGSLIGDEFLNGLGY